MHEDIDARLLAEKYKSIGASLLVERVECGLVKNDYCLDVDLQPLEKDLKTVRDLIREGGYSVRSLQVNELAGGIANDMRQPIKIRIFIFSYYIRVADALSRVETEYNYKPGTVAQLMTLGCAKPELQKSIPLSISGNNSIFYNYVEGERYGKWIFALGYTSVRNLFVRRVGLGYADRFAVIATATA